MTNIVEWKDEELPPVGAIVEFCDSSNDTEGYTSDCWSFGDKLECLAHRESEYNNELIAVFWNINHKTADSSVRFHEGKELYRKIKTDREKAIEAAEEAFHGSVKVPSAYHRHAAELLFDAGMLKLPD